MGKRKRKVFLWLKRPKKSRLINSPYKQCSSRIDGTPLKTPKETPVKKHLRIKVTPDFSIKSYVMDVYKNRRDSHTHPQHFISWRSNGILGKITTTIWSTVKNCMSTETFT